MSTIRVSVKEVDKGKSYELQLIPASSILELLAKLDYSPEVVIVRRNGRIVVEEEQLADGDEIEIIPVVSGG